MGSLLRQDDQIRSLLQRVRTIGVVGASSNPMRDSNKIFGFLLERGYNMVPIHPTEESVHGVRCYATVLEAQEAVGPIDLIDVFRRPEAANDVALATIESEIGAIWYQLDTHEHAATQFALQNGLDVVENRCILVEYHRLMPKQAIQE